MQNKGEGRCFFCEGCQKKFEEDGELKVLDMCAICKANVLEAIMSGDEI